MAPRGLRGSSSRFIIILKVNRIAPRSAKSVHKRKTAGTKAPAVIHHEYGLLSKQVDTSSNTLLL